MFEKISFQGKLWEVKAKLDGSRIDDPSNLKNNYGCDMVIRNNQHFFILDEIIDVEFEDI